MPIQLKKISTNLDRIRSNSRHSRPEILGFPERGEEWRLAEPVSGFSDVSAVSAAPVAEHNKFLEFDDDPICGSLRARSSNAALLEAVARLAPANVEVRAYEGLPTLPLFNPDLDGLDAAAIAADEELATRIRRALDAIITEAGSSRNFGKQCVAIAPPPQ